MDELKYKPIPHDHEAFLKNAKRREGFRKACEGLEEEYALKNTPRLSVATWKLNWFQIHPQQATHS